MSGTKMYLHNNFNEVNSSYLIANIYVLKGNVLKAPAHFKSVNALYSIALYF